jgi:rubrerythrin
MAKSPSMRFKWVCPDCGHIHESETPPDQDCPICGSPAEDYVLED